MTASQTTTWEIQRVRSVVGSERIWLRRDGMVLLVLTLPEYAALTAAMARTEG